MAKKNENIEVVFEASVSAAAPIVPEVPVFADQVLTHTDGTTVLFKCNYSNDFEGEKHMIQGRVYEITTDAVEVLESRGYGKVVPPPPVK
jgi:hypothetical protein